jgi:hypothetical protein
MGLDRRVNRDGEAQVEGDLVSLGISAETVSVPENNDPVPCLDR